MMSDPPSVLEYVSAGTVGAALRVLLTARALTSRSTLSLQAVISWGDPAAGGDQTAVDASLQGGVASVVGNREGRAFAALKMDGTVVAWGDANSGGDASGVQAQLVNIKTLFANPKK